MQEPGMLVSEDQSLGFLTDLGYTQIISEAAKGPQQRTLEHENSV